MTIKIPVPKKLFLCDFYVHAHSLDIQVGKWKWYNDKEKVNHIERKMK